MNCVGCGEYSRGVSRAKDIAIHTYISFSEFIMSGQVDLSGMIEVLSSRNTDDVCARFLPSPLFMCRIGC